MAPGLKREIKTNIPHIKYAIGVLLAVFQDPQPIILIELSEPVIATVAAATHAVATAL